MNYNKKHPRNLFEVVLLELEPSEKRFRRRFLHIALKDHHVFGVYIQNIKITLDYDFPATTDEWKQAFIISRYPLEYNRYIQSTQYIQQETAAERSLFRVNLICKRVPPEIRNIIYNYI